MIRTTLIPLLDREMADYARARRSDDSAAAWRALERAHIISQPLLGPHVRVHATMLGYAIHQRDGREIVGQLARLALAPIGTLTGRIPWGNTGRSNVSALQAMPLPEDLRDQLRSSAR
jgi:hypothetical protein